MDKEPEYRAKKQYSPSRKGKTVENAGSGQEKNAGSGTEIKSGSGTGKNAGSGAGKKLSAAPHDYITPPPCFWPVRRIMAEESEKTYAMIDPMAQKLAVLGLLAGGALSAFLIFAIFMPLLAMPLLGAAQSGGMGFGPAAFVFLAAAIILSVGLLEAYITIKNMLVTYRFSLQDEYIFVRAGTINPAYHMIPYENVQDAQVSQDILLKMFNLASVSVSTPASTMVITPLPLDVANKFRQDVLSLVQLHKGMAE